MDKQYNYRWFLFGLGSLTNFLAYQAFLTGIYNYRNREIVNMRRVPFAFKIGISTALSFSLVYRLYNHHLYDDSIYKVALKYRKEFDPEFLNYFEEQKKFD